MLQKADLKEKKEQYKTENLIITYKNGKKFFNLC